MKHLIMMTIHFFACCLFPGIDPDNSNALDYCEVTNTARHGGRLF